VTEHRDPRGRRHPFAPPQDAAAAAARLESAADEMRAQQLTRGAPVDEPPTGLLDLAAIRAALGADPGGEVNPAAAAWLAGEPEPEPEPVFGDVYVVDEPVVGEVVDVVTVSLVPDLSRVDEAFAHALVIGGEVLEHPCRVLGKAMHTDGPCGPAQHPAAPVEVAPSPPPAPVPAVAPPAPAPVFSSEQHRLTWRSRHDPRSLQFGMRRGLAGSAPLTDHVWPVGPVIDQGVEGCCVGAGIVDAVNAMAPGGPDGGLPEAQALYRAAQRLDDVPGEDYTGTSVLAGLQAARAAGLVGGYVWCFGTKDVAQAVLQRGPVVVGVPWLSGMYDTGPGGLVELAGEDTGAGHCLAVVGIKVRGPQGQLGPYFVWQNSWGTGYGDGGLGYVHHRDLARLLHGTGEAAVPTAAVQS
jgi:hypothetical protein